AQQAPGDQAEHIPAAGPAADAAQVAEHEPLGQGEGVVDQVPGVAERLVGGLGAAAAAALRPADDVEGDSTAADGGVDRLLSGAAHGPEEVRVGHGGDTSLERRAVGPAGSRA